AVSRPSVARNRGRLGRDGVVDSARARALPAPAPSASGPGDHSMTTMTDSRAAPLRVALVCMPFASADRPSIQLGLLKSIVRAEGFGVDTLHFNLDLAARLGPLRYEQLC